MIRCLFFKMIRYAISLLMPTEKPKPEWTIYDVKAALAEKSKAYLPTVLAWDTSLVDLCKTLDLNPSLAARADMYRKAGGLGAYEGTAEQNIWLHGQVMDSLAKHGFVD